MAGLEDVRPGQQGGGGARQGAVGRQDQVPWDTTATTGGAAAPGLASGALAPGMAWWPGRMRVGREGTRQGFPFTRNLSPL